MKSEHPIEKIAFARQLRHTQTPFEKNLWDILRAHRMSGFHFRRQHPIGPYFADFACIKEKLILELDGNSHDERLMHDVQRDAFLKDLGWRILRFPNVYARDNPDGLWSMIEIELRKNSSDE